MNADQLNLDFFIVRILCSVHDTFNDAVIF